MRQVKVYARQLLPVLRTLLSFGFAFVATVCAIMLVMNAWKGESRAIEIYIGKPYEKLAVGLVCLLALYLSRTAFRGTRRYWTRLAGRLSLFAMSVAMCLAAGELAVRLLMLGRLNARRIDLLRRHERGERIRVRGSHPLCHIVRVSPHERLIYELQPGMDIHFGHKIFKSNMAGFREARANRAGDSQPRGPPSRHRSGPRWPGPASPGSSGGRSWPR